MGETVLLRAIPVGLLLARFGNPVHSTPSVLLRQLRRLFERNSGPSLEPGVHARGRNPRMLLLASDAVIPTIMRILIACTHQNVVGGVETYLRDVIAALRGRGHVVGLLASTEAIPSAAPIHETAADLPAWTLAGRDRTEIHRELEVWAPDVAFLHGLDAPADEEALVERFPTVLFAHGHNSTCVSGSRTHAFPIYQPCQKRFGLGCLFHYLPRRCGGLNP